MTPPMVDLIGTVVAALLTIFVFLYLLGDLPGLGPLFKFFYRLALHILVGAGVAYAFVAAFWSVLYLRVFVRVLQASYAWAGAQDFENGFRIFVVVFGPFLGALLLLKGFPRIAWLGNLSTSYLMGVGLGVSVGGALLGTVFTQTRATAEMSGILVPVIDPLYLLAGTLLALIAFSFTATARKSILGILSRFVQLLAGLGRVFIYLALGAVFAGVFVASASVLVGRLQWLIEAFYRLSGGTR